MQGDPGEENSRNAFTPGDPVEGMKKIFFAVEKGGVQLEEQISSLDGFRQLFLSSADHKPSGIVPVEMLCQSGCEEGKGKGVTAFH